MADNQREAGQNSYAPGPMAVFALIIIFLSSLVGMVLGKTVGEGITDYGLTIGTIIGVLAGIGIATIIGKRIDRRV